jgi:hypothetical protein
LLCFIARSRGGRAVLQRLEPQRLACCGVIRCQMSYLRVLAPVTRLSIPAVA